MGSAMGSLDGLTMDSTRALPWAKLVGSYGGLYGGLYVSSQTLWCWPLLWLYIVGLSTMVGCIRGSMMGSTMSSTMGPVYELY